MLLLYYAKSAGFAYLDLAFLSFPLVVFFFSLILLPPTFFWFFGKGRFFPIIKQVYLLYNRIIGLLTALVPAGLARVALVPTASVWPESCKTAVETWCRIQVPLLLFGVFALALVFSLFPFTGKPACFSHLQSCHLNSHWMALGCEICFRSSKEKTPPTSLGCLRLISSSLADCSVLQVYLWV